MSRNRRRFSPHSRKFNERGVERRDDKFVGLSTDHIRTPKNHQEELENARAFNSEIRGRVGTLLHNRADYQVAPSSLETYTQALASGGIIYEAKGSAPETGDIFITSDHNDFQDLALREAKRLSLNSMTSPDVQYPQPWAYEFYEIDLSDTKPKYIGGLSIPHFREFTARVLTAGDDGFNIGKVGSVITRSFTTSPPFTSDLVGMYIVYGANASQPEAFLGVRDVITSVIDSNTLTISRSDLVPDGTYQSNVIQPRIHSSIYMPSVKRMYFHAGEEIYEVSMPIMSWTRLCNISDLKPFPSDSLMSEVKGDIILANDNGHFRIKVSDGNEPSHYWKINTARPNKARNTQKYFFGFEDSVSSEGENPYSPLGFSGMTGDKLSDKTGGMLLS
jgi:hypothetical protein